MLIQLSSSRQPSPHSRNPPLAEFEVRPDLQPRGRRRSRLTSTTRLTGTSRTSSSKQPSRSPPPAPLPPTKFLTAPSTGLPPATTVGRRRSLKFPRSAGPTWATASTASASSTSRSSATTPSGNLLRLTLLRSPKWPDPDADMGHHHFHYALYPHAGTWKDALTIRHGWEYNYPLTGVVTTAHPGSLPVEHSFASRLRPTTSSCPRSRRLKTPRASSSAL
jgi:hypothetical protein